MRGLIRLLAFRVVTRTTIEGLHQVPNQGPVILIVNHSNAFDPMLLMGALTERFAVPLSKLENMKHPLYGWLLRLYSPIPLRREWVDRRALKHSLRVLQDGGALIIAPEGTRSPSMQRGKTGLAYLAMQSGAPILPVGISGMQDWPKFFRGQRAQVTIRFGTPFRINEPISRDVGEKRRVFLRRITDESMYQLARLVDPALRGVYADLAQATTETLQWMNSKGEPCAG